ncbi:hypothetical protein PHYSODRAFT_439672, partial [Phytophthora sojae]
PRPVSLALRAEVEAQRAGVDFAALVELAQSPSLSQWKRLQHSSTFTMLKREDEVLVVAHLDASVEEVGVILGTTTESLHNAAMKGLYGNAFIAGSVPHIQQSQSSHLAVKTSNFARTDILGKNEQWCFAELLQWRLNSNSKSLTIIQKSLSAQQARSLPELVDRKGVAQLRDVTAAYQVERIPGSRNLRVIFHACYHCNTESVKRTRVVARKATQARLLRLARGISQLLHVVRSRRFGLQEPADHSAIDVRNTRCTCCTRRLNRFVQLIPQSKCYLCGYRVCLSCLSSEKIATHNGRMAAISTCARCVESVVACNYDNMLTVQPGPERVLPDPASTEKLAKSTILRQDFFKTGDSTASTAKLAELLGQIVGNEPIDAASNRRAAALKVLNQLLTTDQEETGAENGGWMMAAHQALDVSACPENPNECKLASAESRPYPMVPAVIPSNIDSSDPPESIVYPVPVNEDARLAAIELFKLHEVLNVPELNAICTLAAAEMSCPHSVITLIEREIVTLLATNDPENWDVGSGNPREQTFCQHFVMDDQPLLVRHAEADMRFYHTAPVTMRSLRFYAGFPVSVSSVMKSGRPGEPDKVVVGALCCLDAKPHQITRSQYWRMMKLAEAASCILERNA